MLINFFFENYKMFYYDNFVIVCINVSFRSKGVLLSVILFLVIINWFKWKNIWDKGFFMNGEVCR